MIDTLNAICERAMRRSNLPDDDLIGNGLNANKALKIIKAFWIDTGIELDINIFYHYRSVRMIINAITENKSIKMSKVITLRDGDMTRPVFLYAGGVSCFLEMQDLIDALDFDGVIYGIALTGFQRSAADPPTVQQEIEQSLAAITPLYPHGPYRLVGYSFGGIFALELARRLRADGHDIALLAMIDSPQNDHSLRWKDWAGLIVRIVSRQIRSRLTAKRPAKDTTPYCKSACSFEHSPPRRGHQMMFRFRDPRNPQYPIYAPQWAGGYTPLYSNAARQLLQMKGLYRPDAFDGHVLFFHSRGGSPIDCDPRKIWTAYLPGAEWIAVSGNHQSMIVARNARVIASELDKRLTT